MRRRMIARCRALAARVACAALAALAALATIAGDCAGAAPQAAGAGVVPVLPAAAATLDAAAAARFAGLALRCLHQEYPNHVSHTLNSAADARPPHELTPAFYGCLDWHSAVHGHWLLVRLMRLYPGAAFVPDARAAVGASLTRAHIDAEAAYLRGANRASFERPYGLAWLLTLAAELKQWDDPDARRWSAALAPLATEVTARLARWLPALHYPIRVGEHDQTAFAFGLLWDAAAASGDAQLRALLVDAAQRFYRGDRDCPLAYEPSGEDFLSPCLGEADFMRRVLPPPQFARWLDAFLPRIPRSPASGTGAPDTWLAPAVVTDRADPKLAHIDGLNLSRAWMLEGIAAGLPPHDPRLRALRAAADAHAAAALPAVTGEHYEGGHWLGTFAVYLASRAGIRAPGGE